MQFLPDQRGLTIPSMSNACIKIIQPTDSVDTNLELVIWGTKFGTSDPVSVVAQVELECDSRGLIVPKQVNEVCAIIGGDVTACGQLRSLESQLITALKGTRSVDNCPAHASSEIGKTAAEIEKKGRPRHIENSGKVINWELDRHYNPEPGHGKMVETRMAVKAAGGIIGGKNNGKLLMVVEKVTVDGYRYALALASKSGPKWTVEAKDVMYFLDGKKIHPTSEQKTFTDGVNAEKIAAFLN